MPDEQQSEHPTHSPDPDQSPQHDFRIVPANHGVLWIKRGITLFRIAPTVWLASSVILFLSLLFLYVIGIVLPILFPLTFIASSMFIGSLMIGCQRLHQHKKFDIACLFAGFERFTAPLSVVGLYYFLGTVLSYLFAFSLATKIGFEIYPVDTSQLLNNPEEAQKFIESLLLPMLLMLLFMIPVLMSFWFSPALVVFFNNKPLVALKKSFFACTYNTIPFLVYGLVAFIAVIGISLLIGIVSAIIPVLGLLINIAFQFILIGITIATIYTAFDDIFPSLATQGNTDSEQPTDHLVA